MIHYKPRVYLTVPNGEGMMHKSVHFAVIRLLQDPRFNIRHDCPTHRPFENNLHHCIQDFLKGGEDFWLSIDNDNPPTANVLDRVLDDLDFVGFPTPVYHNTLNGERPWYWNAYKKHSEKEGYNEWPVQSGLQNVDAVGTGCFLASRRVMAHPLMAAPFLRRCDDEGRVIRGNDIAFCERAKMAGFDIWADFDRPCEHFVTIPMIETIKSINSVRNN